jgi:predicted transcriptional regulator
MHNATVTRDNWASLADEAGVSLELIAVLTGISYSAVYRYKTGSRTAPDTWIAKVAIVIADRAINRPATGEASA